MQAGQGEGRLRLLNDRARLSSSPCGPTFGWGPARTLECLKSARGHGLWLVFERVTFALAHLGGALPMKVPPLLGSHPPGMEARRTVLHLLAFAIALLSSGSAAAHRALDDGAAAHRALEDPQHPLVISSELGLAVLATRGQGTGAFTPGAGVAYQTGPWLVGVTFFATAWQSPLVRQSGSEWLLSLCSGAVLQRTYSHGRARTALSLGPSFFVDTSPTLDAPVTPGFFVDLRPLGFRFELSEKWHWGVDPLGVRLVMTELSAIPIYDTQFQTTLRLELGL